MRAAMAPLRTWVTPLTIGVFFLMSATGVLMFFGWDRGLTAGVHQWFSWLFLAVAGGHIAVNFRPFKNHLQSRWGQVSTAVLAAVLVASFSSWGIKTGDQLRETIERALTNAPLSALASMTHTDPDTVISRLKVRGVIADSGQSIHDLSREYGVGEHRLLAIVFLTE